MLCYVNTFGELRIVNFIERIKGDNHYIDKGMIGGIQHESPSPIPRMIKHTKGQHYKYVGTHKLYLRYCYMVVMLIYIKQNEIE